jgi:glycosyltransferase involved in cell wall biosynthesis
MVFFLSSFAKKNNVCVIHAWHPIAGLGAVLAARVTGTKVFLDWTDLYSEIVRHESPIFAPVARFIERYIARNADQIFTVSDEMKIVVHSLGASIDKIHVVPDGVDDSMFRPDLDGQAIRERYNLASGSIAMFHGDVKYIDGVDILIRAFALAHEQISSAKLLIVGGGRGYFDEIRRLTVQLGIAESVVFVGWVPHHSVPELIAAADVGVMPLRSTLQTNCYLSFKIFEYWAMAKPVIVSRLKAISSIAKNGFNGLLVEPTDIEGLAQAMVNVLKDPAKAVSMGKNGRACVEEAYTWNKIMEKEAAFYDSFFRIRSFERQT